MSELKLGKKPATVNSKDFKFVDYVDKSLLPTSFPRANFGYGTRFKDWGMYGNGPDPTLPSGYVPVGDCVVASRAHRVRLATSIGPLPTARFTAKGVVDEYSAITGYVVGDESTDNGTDMRAMCSYQRKTGLLDADGVRHKIGAYLSIEPGDTLAQLQAIWIFGGYCMGFVVVESAMEQFDNGQVWDDVGDTNELGGHEICGVGTMDWRERETFVSWGRRQEATLDFVKKYNDENWVYVDPEILSGTGTWRGLNLDQINADLNAL